MWLVREIANLGIRAITRLEDGPAAPTAIDIPGARTRVAARLEGNSQRRARPPAPAPEPTRVGVVGRWLGSAHQCHACPDPAVGWVEGVPCCRVHLGQLVSS